MKIFIEGGYLITQEKVFKEGGVLIEDNLIVEAGDLKEVKKSVGRGFERIRANGKMIIPGLINTHTHISMTLFRGYADDYPLQEWLEKWIWPIEAKLKPEDIEIGAMLGALESIRMGVTTICTLYHYHPDHNEASGLLRIGLRGVVGIAVFTWQKDENIRNIKNALSRWHGRDGLIRVAVGPHAPYTVDPDLWIELSELRRWADEKYGDSGRVIITTHVAEDPNEAKITSERFNVKIPNGSLFKYLDNLGVLNEYFLAAHAIHLSNDDIKAIKDNNVKISHNPISNMKLGMGISPIYKLINEGIIVGLGTDGPASNNTLDIFETMKITSLLQKVITGDPTSIPARTAFKMATIYGAKALSYSGIGDIKPGYLADITIINLSNPHLIPIYDPISHLVYCIRSLDVDTVIINGEIKYHEGKFIGIDVNSVYEKVNKSVSRLLSEVSDIG